MLTFLVPVLVAAIAAGGAWLVARRQGSGRIATSEASDLWAESNAMRQELRDEVAALRIRIDNLRAAEQECQRKIAALQDELDDLKLRWGMS